MECLDCPYGSYCGVATASPRACPDGTFGGLPVGLRTGLSHRDNCTACGQGHWCSAGTRYACNEEFYSEATNASKPSACKRCPDQSTTGVKGSTSRRACKCAPRYFALSALDSADAEAGGIRCETCQPSSMDCSVPGSALGTLLLKPGWWRLSNASATTYRCASYEHCPPPNASETASRRRLEAGAGASRERWGVGGHGCRVGHRGPLCAKCEPGWAVGFDGLCEQCSDEVRTRSLTTIAVGGVVLVVIAAAALAFMLPRTQKRLKERKRRDSERRSSKRSGRRSESASKLAVTVSGRLRPWTTMRDRSLKSFFKNQSV